MQRSSAPVPTRLATRLPQIDPGRCTGCGWCVPTCDLHLLSLDTVRGRKTSVLHDAASCTGCSRCALKCPFGAITMARPVPVAGAATA